MNRDACTHNTPIHIHTHTKTTLQSTNRPISDQNRNTLSNKGNKVLFDFDSCKINVP